MLRRATLDRLIQRFIRAHPQLRLTKEGDSFVIEPVGSTFQVSVTEGQGDVCLETKDWHGHYRDAEDAVWHLAALLSGVARTAIMQRGNRLAGTWLEVWVGESYDQRNVAVFLSPFDSEDWQLWPGEQWQTVRTRRRYIDAQRTAELRRWPVPSESLELGTESSFSRSEDEPGLGLDESFFDLIAHHVGAARQGFRWILDRNQRCVMQVPLGWRQTPVDEPSNLTRFQPFAGGHTLDLQTFFRDAEEPGDLARRPCRPVSIDRVELGVWNLAFTNGIEEMLAIVELRCGSPDASMAEEHWTAMEGVLGETAFILPVFGNEE